MEPQDIIHVKQASNYWDMSPVHFNQLIHLFIFCKLLYFQRVLLCSLAWLIITSVHLLQIWGCWGERCVWTLRFFFEVASYSSDQGWPNLQISCLIFLYQQAWFKTNVSNIFIWGNKNILCHLGGHMPALETTWWSGMGAFPFGHCVDTQNQLVRALKCLRAQTVNSARESASVLVPLGLCCCWNRLSCMSCFCSKTCCVLPISLPLLYMWRKESNISSPTFGKDLNDLWNHTSHFNQ